MIQFKKYSLDNDLRLILHQDSSTPIVSVNIAYDVGARDESPEKTGFAHLFEHLMFGGSKNIPAYDKALQEAGGDNNAFTNNNYTNYYLTVPKENLETALWLESDRMLELAFSNNSLEVQRSVVIEEFKQRYLNQPYGNAWKLIREMAYKKHPYRWETIGRDISHIENATMDDVKNFFYSYYAPNNAVMCISGDINPNETLELVKKWFGKIPVRKIPKRNLPAEPMQEVKRFKKVSENVPANAIYKVWHVNDRIHQDYYTIDLISDILSNGKSSRLYRNLVKGEEIFSEINAFITGDFDPGLIAVTGKIHEEIDIAKADKAIEDEIQKLLIEGVSSNELEKVKNRVESVILFSRTKGLNIAMELCYFELIGKAENINQEIEKYRSVQTEDFSRVANTIFTENNCSTLHYLSSI